jgi:hypothetical protein
MAKPIITQTTVYIGMRTTYASWEEWKLISLLPFYQLDSLVQMFWTKSVRDPSRYNDIIRETFQFWWQNASTSERQKWDRIVQSLNIQAWL